MGKWNLSECDCCLENGAIFRGKNAQNIHRNNGSSEVSIHFIFAESSCPIITFFRCKVFKRKKITTFRINNQVGVVRANNSNDDYCNSSDICVCIVIHKWPNKIFFFNSIQLNAGRCSWHLFHWISCFFCPLWPKGNANNAIIISIHTCLRVRPAEVCEYQSAFGGN